MIRRVFTYRVSKTDKHKEQHHEKRHVRNTQQQPMPPNRHKPMLQSHIRKPERKAMESNLNKNRPQLAHEKPTQPTERRPTERPRPHRGRRGSRSEKTGLEVSFLRR